MPRVVLFLSLLLASCLVPVAAQDKAGARGEPQALQVPDNLSAEQADALLARLTDAQARHLLGRQLHEAAKRKAPESAAAAGGFDSLLVNLRMGLEDGGDTLRARAQVVREGWPLVSGSLATSMNKIAGGQGYSGFRRQVVILFALVAAGLLAAWLVRRGVIGRDSDAPAPAAAGFVARLGAAFSRFVQEMLPLAAFCLVTLGLPVLLFEPGGADRTFHVTYATGAAILVAAAIVSRMVFSPRAPALRLLPLNDAAALFIHRWLLWVFGAGVFAWLTAGLLILTGVPLKAQLVITLITGSFLAVLLLIMIVEMRKIVAAAISGEGVAAGAGSERLRNVFAASWHYFAILYVMIVYLLWGLNVLGQRPSTVWAAIVSVAVVLAFPLLDRWMRRGIDDLFSPIDGAAAAARPEYAVVLHRITRLLAGALVLAGLSGLWGLNLFGETGMRLQQAVLSSSLDLIAAVLIAILGWQFIRIGIDRQLTPREVNGVVVQPTQRMRTLLPLARKFLVVLVVVITTLLVLSGLGVNIGPLLAGAGVVGIAIGFGAQTLVRDILTGVFFLLDDAFRVGEYVVSGNYKGNVEAITLRAVKLRHHRGSVYTVPFGELRAIQNMSRDWVIDKFTIGITYDSDIEKARKLIKKIGQELAANPEFAPHIIEPLKMQGVEQFGDFAVQVRVKMMTRPNEQFVIRRKALAMIKKSFDENGVKFAFPTVQVAGGSAEAGAVAQQALAGARPDAAPAA